MGSFVADAPQDDKRNGGPGFTVIPSAARDLMVQRGSPTGSFVALLLRMTEVGAAPCDRHLSAAAVKEAERVDEGGWAAEPVVSGGAGADLKPLLMLFFASVSFRIIYEKKC